MSLLDVKGRPWAIFNPKNAEHRGHYAQFLKKRSWRSCPVQFYLEQGYGDLPAMIENKLSAYYLGQEFRKRVPERGESWAGQEVSNR